MKKIFWLLALVLLTSCNARKNVVYVQDLHLNQATAIANQMSIKVQPGDQLQIVISCKDPELAAILNMPVVSFQTSNGNMNNNNTIMSYLVDTNGDISYPLLGKLHVAGLTREEVKILIENMIKEAELIQDFVVSVNYSNLKIYVLGEVNSPGTYSITDNDITLFQALAMAKDLTINGKRDEVFVMRENGNDRISYKMDLRSDSIFQSPAFYLKQNDVIYVAPNKVRARQSTVNGNSMLSASMWISIASILTTLYVGFVK